MSVAMMTIPARIYNGFGSLSMLGEESKRLGSKAFVVTTGNHMKSLGILEKVTTILNKQGQEVYVYNGITPNPKTSEIEEGAALLKENQCDFIISLGISNTYRQILTVGLGIYKVI